MQYLWKLVYIWNIEKVGKNALDKRTVVLEEVNDKDYKWWLAFDLIKDKVFLTDEFKVWDTVEVSLNFKASEYNGRWFTNINAWKITASNSKTEEDDLESLPF